MGDQLDGSHLRATQNQALHLQKMGPKSLNISVSTYVVFKCLFLWRRGGLVANTEVLFLSIIVRKVDSMIVFKYDYFSCGKVFVRKV